MSELISKSRTGPPMNADDLKPFATEDTEFTESDNHKAL
jgi:hypothetical protein